MPSHNNQQAVGGQGTVYVPYVPVQSRKFVEQLLLPKLLLQCLLCLLNIFS